MVHQKCEEDDKAGVLIFGKDETRPIACQVCTNFEDESVHDRVGNTVETTAEENLASLGKKL